MRYLVTNICSPDDGGWYAEIFDENNQDVHTTDRVRTTPTESHRDALEWLAQHRTDATEIIRCADHDAA